METVIYGIPNCDTIKKARHWLTQQGIAHRFHDFKKDGIDISVIHSWLAQADWEVLLNRKGTTWRGLDEARQAAVVDAASAASLMLESPSLIKRPVLVHGDQVHVGFSDDLYQRIFSSHS